jgi:hypothetical protein
MVGAQKAIGNLRYVWRLIKAPELVFRTVGLLHAYLNRGDLLHDLGELTRQLSKALERGEPLVARSVSTVAPGFRQRRLADRLDDAQVQAIVSAFEASTPRWQLAEQHGISVRSVGRLLRKWRAQRDVA